MGCKQCGSDDILTRHVMSGDLIDSSSFSNINDEFCHSIEYDIFYKVKASKEHLKKHCKNCHFGWRQNVINDLPPEEFGGQPLIQDT